MSYVGQELNQEQIEAMVRPIPGDFVVYHLIGRQMKVLYFTDTILSSFGVTAEEFSRATRDDALDVVMPADREYVLATVFGKPAGPELIHCRFRLMHREKGFFWVHSRSRIIGTMDGCPVVLTNYLNASAEAESYSRIMDDTTLAFCTVDARTKEVLYANRAARDFSRVENSAVYAAHPCYEYFFQRREPCEACPMAQLGMGQALSRERYDQDHERWYSVHYKRVSWLGHDCLEISSDDITELKAREMKERANSLVYRMAARQIKMSIWEYDIPGGRLFLRNDGEEATADARGMKGAVLEDFPARMLRLLATDADRERFRRMIDDIRGGREFVSGEFWFHSEDGASSWCEQVSYYTQKDETGKPVLAYGVGLDVTAEKREMEKFRQSVESLLALNPNSLCAFQINLTRNECSEGHGTSGYVRRLLQSDTADGLLNNIVSIIPDPGQRKRAAELFDRKKLLDTFGQGKANLSIDYLREGEDGRPFWVRTYINMLKNPETQDVIGVFYSLDISRERQQDEIFQLITAEEYDFVALLHAGIRKIEFLSLNRRLLEKYRDAFGKPGVLYDYDRARLFSADSWVDAADRAYYLKNSDVDALKAELDRNGHCELSVRGHYTGRPDEFMCRKLQHYYLGKGRDAILIIQADVTETYRQQQQETMLARSEKAQLSDILNGLSAGICVLNMPDAGHVRTSFCNRQMYKLLDIPPNVNTPEELNGRSDQLVAAYFQDEFSGIHAEDRERVRELFRQGYDRPAFTVPNVRFIGGGGDYKYLTLDLVLRERRPDERVFYAVYRDVSEEISLQQELEKQRQAQLERTLVDTIGNLPANYALYRANDDGSLTPERYSDDFCRMKGCTQEDIRGFNGENGFAPVHPDDREALKTAVLACRGDCLMHHAVYRILTRSSGYKWVSVNYSFFAAGDRKYLYAVYTDIDELKRQEQQLREQYDAAQAYLDSVSGTYIATRRINLTRNVIESVKGMNPLAEARGIADYDRYVAALLTAIPSGEDRRRCETLYARSSLLDVYERGDRSLSLEYPYRTPEGEIIWVRNIINLIRRPGSGDIIAFSAVSNINQERLTGAIMDTLVKTKYDNISCVDAESGRVVFYFSPSHTLGEKVISKGMDYEAEMREYNDKFVVPADREACSEAMRLKNVLSRLEKSDSCVLSFSVTENRVPRAKQAEFFYIDRLNHLIGLVRSDITEAQRQQTEQTARLQEALTAAENANRAKSDFLSRMSHDIRTPLNGIIGMTYLTEQMELPAEARENLSKIDTSSQFLLGLINDVLDMSKAESGRLELHPEPYNAQTFAGYLQAVIAPLCREKNLKFVIDAETVSGVDMLMDPLRINQVFFNLLSNAVKFTPEGGSVTYRLREKRLGENRISITAQVADTGIGMSEEFQKILFDPFTQENRRDSSETRGTGLGLAIVKKILDAMGGTIRVESRVHEGTTFTVHADVDCVPARETPRAARADALSDNGPALAGKHILLCEDHPLNQELAVALLKARGAVVTVAEDGKIGTGMFLKSIPHYYDAVLMDIRMPVMDGYEATKAIRALDRPDARTVPIIAMTADAFSDDVQKCLDAGMNGHIAKPIDPQRLYEMLAKVTAGEKRVP